MAEEHRCKSPEGHRLCANNCGFFGSPTTLNLCSKCYRDLRLKEEQASSAKFAVEKSLAASSSSSTTNFLSPPPITLPESADDRLRPVSITTASESPSEPTPPEPTTQPNRCSTCRKRVGLTGFKCKCGTTFCSSHRYPEQHNCTFDFKTVGRESIAKANPVVKADKLEKI
ncbi:zinc finger protein [Macleaya cordata]|uniref:Zinc finger protein n=1 Tax=Macleaya cordata TaxID=56857 RepID=A0A200Q672_MACCD|nr:zinc finger protein [Macleaya cordata]